MVKFAPGDVIATCEPLAAVVAAEYKGKICDWCFKDSISLKRCSKCSLVFYCGAKCQKKDWKAFHKWNECEELTKLGQVHQSQWKAAMDGRLIDRIHFLLDNQDRESTRDHRKMFETSTKMFDGTVRTIGDLPKSLYRARDIFEVIPLNNREADIDNRLKDLAMEHGLDVSRVRNVREQAVQIVNANTFEIGPHDCSSVASLFGIAVYLEFTAFKHSCLPNSAAIHIGNRLQIRAIKDIDTETDVITINYFDAFWLDLKAPCDSHVLRRVYNYECRCQLCDSKMMKNLDDQLVEVDKRFKEASKLKSLLSMPQIGLDRFRIIEKRRGKYHPRTFCALEIAVSYYLARNNIPPKNLIDKLRECGAVAFGKDHSVYKNMEAHIAEVSHLELDLIQKTPVVEEKVKETDSIPPGLNDLMTFLASRAMK